MVKSKPKKYRKKSAKKKVWIAIGLMLATVSLILIILAQSFTIRTLPWRGGMSTDMLSLQTSLTKLDLPKPNSTSVNQKGCTEYGSDDITAYCERSITYLYKISGTFWPALHDRLISQGWVFATTPGGTPFDGTNIANGVVAHIATACLSISLQLDHQGGWNNTYGGVITIYARGSNLCNGTSTNPKAN